MSLNYNFAVFILTHGRADNCVTVKTLRKCGYTGKIILILDNTDKSIERYRSNYPDCEIYVFDKEHAINITDSADNTRNPKAVVYARNMCHDIAEELGYEYFLELDDDYSTFDFKSDNNNNYISHKKIKNLDKIISIFLEFLGNTTTTTIAFSQGGDFIGGYGNKFGSKISLQRKCMNSFFCKTDRKFQFYGLINEDVNAYVLDGSRGNIFFTSTHISLEQVQTQKNSGGLTTIYLELGTYVKSFYSVIYHPSSVVVKDMGLENRRLHHSIDAELTYPKILHETYKKL
jgi:hypothetical protein